MQGKFLRYFMYLSSNWSVKIATHILKHEIAGEKKYGIDTTGADELKALEKKGIDISHATIYMPATYDLLEEIFSILRPNKNSHFLDIGCGKGRVMCVAAHYHFKKITGIDFSKKLCDAANKNLLATQQQLPYLNFSVINSDAFYYEIPTDVDYIFLFNPFDDVIMSGVVNNILQSHWKKPRKITLIYLNTLHKQLFIDVGFIPIWHSLKMKYIEAGIFELPK